MKAILYRFSMPTMSIDIESIASIDAENKILRVITKDNEEYVGYHLKF